MKTLKDIQYVEGVKILVRADFNVPVSNGVVVDDFRIRMVLPTINILISKGAKVILISHLEASDGTNPSLKPVADSLTKLGVPVTFVENMRNASAVISTQTNGTCVLLNNLRLFAGEKANDPQFSKELASLGDIYVNDAFSVSHRAHASVVGVPALLPSYAGLQLESEVANLSKAFDPSHPFVFILGGAKFETKLPLLQKFLTLADTVFVGGALANDFFKAQGHEVGTSLISKGTFDFAPFLSNPKLMIPTDVVNQEHITKAVSAVLPTDKIMDAGSATIDALKKVVASARFILWNGPVGLYQDGYQGATLDIARMIAEATQKGAVSIIGGGDTLAAVAEIGVEEHYTFMSTGGGAMLDFLAQGTLPGIEALERSTTQE